MAYEVLKSDKVGDVDCSYLARIRDSGSDYVFLGNMASERYPNGRTSYHNDGQYSRTGVYRIERDVPKK